MELIPQGNILWIKNGGDPLLNDRYPIVGYLLWAEEKYLIIEVNNVVDGVSLKEYWLDSGIRIRDTIYDDYSDHKVVDRVYGTFIKQNLKDIPRDKKGDLFESSLISTDAYKTLIPIECEVPESFDSLRGIDLNLANKLNFIDNSNNTNDVVAWKSHVTRRNFFAVTEIFTRKVRFEKENQHIGLTKFRRRGHFKFLFGAWFAAGDWDGDSNRLLFGTNKYPNYAGKYSSAETFEEAFDEYADAVFRRFWIGHVGPLRKEVYWALLLFFLFRGSEYLVKEYAKYRALRGTGTVRVWVDPIKRRTIRPRGGIRSAFKGGVDWFTQNKDLLLVISVIILLGGFEINKSFYAELRCRLKTEFVPTTIGDPVNHYPPDPLFFGSGF